MVQISNATVFWDIARSTLASAGILSAVFGLFGKRWLSAVEAKHARILEGMRAGYSSELEGYKNELERSKQMLQAEISKTLLVTRVHFETEFQALKDVFALLAEIRLQFPNLRPRMRIARADETRQTKTQELNRAKLALQEVYNKLVAVSENSSPFYPVEIYSQINICEQVIRVELSEIALARESEVFSLAWFDQGERRLGEFIEAYGRVSELIRMRIARLAIVRND